jgi:hypothetical protein
MKQTQNDNLLYDPNRSIRQRAEFRPEMTEMVARCRADGELASGGTGTRWDGYSQW